MTEFFPQCKGCGRVLYAADEPHTHGDCLDHLSKTYTAVAQLREENKVLHQRVEAIYHGAFFGLAEQRREYEQIVAELQYKVGKLKEMNRHLLERLEAEALRASQLTGFREQVATTAQENDLQAIADLVDQSFATPHPLPDPLEAALEGGPDD